MRLSRWAALATLALGLVSFAFYASLLLAYTPGLSSLPIALAFLLLLLAGPALLAWGYWALPERRGRGLIALGFVAPLLSGLASMLAAATHVDVPFFAISGLLSAVYGLAAAFAASWWAGHEPSRRVVVACIGLLGLAGLFEVVQPLSWPGTLLGLANVATSALQIAALLPAFEGPAEPAPAAASNP